MSDQVVIALVASIAPTLAAVAALIATLLGNRKVDSVHSIVNGQRAEMEKKIAALEAAATKVAVIAEQAAKQSS